MIASPSVAMLARLAIGYLQAGGWLRRARAAVHGVATGFFARALTLEEQAWVSIAIYETAAGRRPARALHEWEQAWFERRLPAPPARILVAAAGEGPEVRRLAERGYQVDAFERGRRTPLPRDRRRRRRVGRALRRSDPRDPRRRAQRRHAAVLAPI